MFKINYKRALKLEKEIDSLVSYDTSTKSFRVVMKGDVMNHEQTKKIDKMGLKIVGLRRKESGELVLFLKNKSALAQIVIVILAVEVLLFSLIILQLTTNFR